MFVHMDCIVLSNNLTLKLNVNLCMRKEINEIRNKSIQELEREVKSEER